MDKVPSGHPVLVAHPLAQISLLWASRHGSGVGLFSTRLIQHILPLLALINIQEAASQDKGTVVKEPFPQQKDAYLCV